MSISNGYATLPEVKGWLGVDDTGDDTELEVAVEAASRMIDDWCGRRFYAATETRYYTACRHDLVRVDDLVTVTTLKTDASGDGTFETTWTSAEYRLEPFNAAVQASEKNPYTRIARATTSGRSFPLVERGVEVVGSFGWPTAAPTAVKQACILQAHRLFRHAKEAPLGVVALPGVEGAGGMRLVARIDPDVQVLLTAYRRGAVLVG